MKPTYMSYLLESLSMLEYEECTEDLKIAKGKYELPTTLKGAWDKLKEKRW